MEGDGQNKSTESKQNTAILTAKNAGLLCGLDASPVTMLCSDSRSPFLLVCDHAGRSIPHALGTLGLSEEDQRRHIAWDIGVAGTGAALSAALGAGLVAQTYSRLVIDCNRRPGHPTSIAPESDLSPVPGNVALTAAGRSAREAEIFTPYQDAIASVLDRRRNAGCETVLVALHSFTPNLRNSSRPTGCGAGDTPPGSRPWHVGVLYNHDPRFAVALRDLLTEEGDLVVGDNQPYFLSDLDDYTVPVHGEQRGLLHVEIEIRQDLIGDAAGEAAWAARLARLLPRALERCGTAPPC